MIKDVFDSYSASLWRSYAISEHSSSDFVCPNHETSVELDSVNSRSASTNNRPITVNCPILAGQMGDELPNAVKSLNLRKGEISSDTSSEESHLKDQVSAQGHYSISQNERENERENNTQNSPRNALLRPTDKNFSTSREQDSSEFNFSKLTSSSSPHLSARGSSGTKSGHKSQAAYQHPPEYVDSEAKSSSTSRSSRVRSNGSPGLHHLDDRTMDSIPVNEQSISTSDSNHTSGAESSPSAKSIDGEPVAKISSHSDQNHTQPEASPFDNIDMFLPNASPLPSRSNTHKGPDANRRRPRPFSPYRAGLLSFREHNRSSDDEDLANSDEEGSLWGGSTIEKSLHGVRRKQTVKRKLETENMELRLKLQQYREMNASEQEISRAKRQLARSERRIDELEQSLERKNQTIRELCEQRDQTMQRVQSDKTKELYETIEELQTAITQLEEESIEAEKISNGAIAQAHADLPEIVAENANMKDLLNAIRRLSIEKSELQSMASSASSLRSQHGTLKDELEKAGRVGDPLLCIRELLSELAQLQSENSSTRGILGKENRDLRRENERSAEAYHTKVKELEDLNEKLKERAEHDGVVRQDLEVKLIELEKLLMESRATSYAIIRGFFAELFDVMGPDFQTTVEQQLAKIMNHAKEKGLSKIPLLLELLVRYTRQLGEAAIKSELAPQQDRKIWALEKELQSLEQMMDLKWSRAGADAVLVAQVRDLKRQLKLEEEKRKSEWMEYQHSIEQARR